MHSLDTIPAYVAISFTATTLLSIWLFFKATNHSKQTLIFLISWAILQSFAALSGLYLNTSAVPPRILLSLLPVFIFIGVLFNSQKGKAFIDSLSLEKLTLLHTVRVPVEIVLYWLFLHKAIPQLMTFEGRNFDILAGITAPIIYYFVFVKKKLSHKILLGWNIVCLLLLINIVVNAILASPVPFQQFAFEQPNIAILYFPYNLLPSVVVPLVLFSHLVVIRRLLK
ncbi:hypothetical protein GCM10011514_05280 [Emticicia aquatilis]|uniref:Uncharacterized protein n=1 Tax=Emticicia aquatilis TaxID=1537369 RepID=A0A916YGV7_9BACT|nr:hypothetical protein [Emticicia aquatilis]GGD44289.1 hypothetical protein GCM10011514_05280 [Emticicia aquatilis]